MTSILINKIVVESISEANFVSVVWSSHRFFVSYIKELAPIIGSNTGEYINVKLILRDKPRYFSIESTNRIMQISGVLASPLQ